MVKTVLVETVAAYVSGAATFGEVAEELLVAERTDITAQSAVRYLLNIGRWDFKGPNAAEAMEHLFGNYRGKVALVPDDYIRETRKQIAELWHHDIEDPTPHVPEASVVEEKPSKRKGKDKPSDEGESGSKTFKSLRQHEQADAS